MQSEINPFEIPLLQMRAAIWFEQHANLDGAFKYALANGGGEWAANLIEGNIRAMIKTGEISTLTRWIGKLPDEVIHQRPRLSLAYTSLRKTARIARKANNMLVMIVAACHLAEMQAMQGQLSQALVTLQKAQFMAMDPDGSPLPLAGIVDIGLGEILRERDILEEAKEYLERGCQITQALWSLSSLESSVRSIELEVRG